MSRSRLLAALLAATAALSACGGGDSGPATGTPSKTAAPAPAGPGAKPSRLETVDWPAFGRVPERTHYIANAPDPPFHFRWQFFARQLIEFPPDVAGPVMYVVNKTGGLYAVRTADAKVLWKRDLDRDVAGPALYRDTLYIGQYDGDFVALDARDGSGRWSFDPPGHLESSPLVVDGTVYFGDDSGVLWALDARSGKVRWRVDIGPEIKASPSSHEGVVYVGDYSGGIHAVSARNGHRLWDFHAPTDAGFYSSPAIAFGHVYEASSSGTLFALDMAGHQDWSFQTGDDVYGSPAVGAVKGLGPTVYIGSYDHNLYALDARSGKRRWKYDVGGQIPGGPTLVGNTVYTSSFETSKTTGLDASTGKPVFTWGSAGYEPLISDGRRLYLTGFQTVWSFSSKAAGSAGPASGPADLRRHPDRRPQGAASLPPPTSAPPGH
jgi:outer membrane protein assembly factor BamB